jgi:hypothetical protein
MELYKLHMLKHSRKLPNGPATYQLLIAREASQTGSVQSVDFPSWDSLAGKLASVGVDEGELQEAKRDLDGNRYCKMTGVPLSPPQIELLGALPYELRKTR